MSKPDLIAAIRRRNPSADELFLRGFDEPSLRQYLGRLALLNARGGRTGVWVRDTTQRSVVTR